MTAGELPVNEPAVPTAVLAYQSPSESIAAIELLYRVAWYCWSIPLVAGVSILLLFAATHAIFLPLLGLVTLVVGGAAFVVGMLCLFVYVKIIRIIPAHTMSTTPHNVRSLVVRLLINIPTAIACTVGGVVLL